MMRVCALPYNASTLSLGGNTMSYLRNSPFNEKDFPAFAAMREQIGFLPNFYVIEKMIKPESLVINPELVAIIGVEAAHVLEPLKRSLDVKSNADLLGPFALGCLIERFALFDAAAGKFRHVGRTGLG